MATNQRRLKCSPEDVFEVLRNGWLYPTWVVGASRMRGVEEQWPEPGASIHHSFGVWPLLIDDTTTILACDPPRTVSMKARGWPLGTAKVELRVEPLDDGCLVVVSEDAEEGPGRLIPKPVRDTLIHIRNIESLRRLGYLAEGYVRSRPGG